jgi:glucose/arabinose dehydrogenase
MRLGNPMRPFGRVILIVVCIATLLPLGGLVPEPVQAAEKVRLAKVAGSLDQPLFVTGAGTGSSRLFVVERPGRIRVVKQGRLLATPFLNIREIVNDEEGERGLLGLAFHPAYATNGQFFVDYTDEDGDIVIARYTVSSGNPDVADKTSGEIILTIPHREAQNHNGGMLAFGPTDGYLYISVGDGGGGQSANAQDTSMLLGKILRLDVDGASGGRNYAIPPDNPFADDADRLPEIWAYGLRNPFRFSFDRDTGDMFIGDVGQNAWEEIDFDPASSEGGINYGWHITEGRHCYKPPTGCDKTGLTPPIHEYSHDIGNVVTGGYRYRGQAIPALVGTYVFTDFGSKVIWGLRNRQGKWERSVLLRAKKELNIASFGESDAGELFAVDLVKGALYRVMKA